MAGHDLIAAELKLLTERLPAQAVEELADGLQEAYERQLEEHHDPDAAALAAIAEFGDADTITTAFLRESPWRRTALLLLATGPVVGAAWAATLMAGQAWLWPLPAWSKVLYGTALIMIVIFLIMVVRAKRHYRRTRAWTAAAAFGLLAMDGLMLIITTLMMPGPMWPLALAAPASLIRLLATARALPAVLSRG
jgi:hypothetical protein